ncbi:MAG TPA: hypothetical protein VNI54_02905 [Thermoanaerobaculia bacterium]|nr:hypothetical protein [Thermoanaerobaculia bacterium]
MIADYCFRRSVLESGRTYSLFDDRIVIEGMDLQAQTYLLADVQKVHLKYEHTKQREYYECYIHTRRGRISLRHVSYRGFGDFEDRRKTYTPFVKALLAELARVPGVQFQGGSMTNFVGAIVGLPVMLGLTWLCVSLGRYGLGIFAAMMGGLAGIMIAPSKPRRVDPLEPPADLLPE